MEEAGTIVEGKTENALITGGVLHCMGDDNGVVVTIGAVVGKNGKGVGAKVTRFLGGTQPIPYKIAK